MLSFHRRQDRPVRFRTPHIAHISATQANASHRTYVNATDARVMLTVLVRNTRSTMASSRTHRLIHGNHQKISKSCFLTKLLVNPHKQRRRTHRRPIHAAMKPRMDMPPAVAYNPTHRTECDDWATRQECRRHQTQIPFGNDNQKGISGVWKRVPQRCYFGPSADQ
jgi:hypothetical protein